MGREEVGGRGDRGKVWIILQTFTLRPIGSKVRKGRSNVKFPSFDKYLFQSNMTICLL